MWYSYTSCHYLCVPRAVNHHYNYSIVENTITSSINVCWFCTVVTSTWIRCWCVSIWVAVVEVVTTLQRWPFPEEQQS